MELPLPLHHTGFEGPSVLVALGPGVGTLTILKVVLEVALVAGAVCVLSEPIFAMPAVSEPASFVLSHNSISISGTVINLQSVPLPHHLVGWSLHAIFRHGRFLVWINFFDDLLGLQVQVADFAVVDAAVCGTAEAFEM